MKKSRLLRDIDNYINDNRFSMIYKNKAVDIINYTKILDFSDTLISFNYDNNTYIIEGSNLVISKMMDNEMLITGNIEKITFI